MPPLRGRVGLSYTLKERAQRRAIEGSAWNDVPRLIISISYSFIATMNCFAIPRTKYSLPLTDIEHMVKESAGMFYQLSFLG